MEKKCHDCGKSVKHGDGIYVEWLDATAAIKPAGVPGAVQLLRDIESYLAVGGEGSGVLHAGGLAFDDEKTTIQVIREALSGLGY